MPILLALSIANILLALGIVRYERFLHMTGYYPYAPPAAIFLVEYQGAFVAVARAIPVVALGLWFVRRDALSLLICVSLCALTVFQIGFTLHTVITCQPGLAQAR